MPSVLMTWLGLRWLVCTGSIHLTIKTTLQLHPTKTTPRATALPNTVTGTLILRTAIR
jgi:hypothetical protein